MKTLLFGFGCCGRNFLFLITSATLLAMGPPPAMAADAPSSSIVRESIEWSDIWIEDANNHENKLPRVLFIGDSIVRAFYPAVSKSLAGKALTGRLSTSYFASDPLLLGQVQLILDNFKPDIIYFNNGMHGWGRSEEDYQEGLPQLVDTIKKYAPQAKLIWAMTTPLKDGTATAPNQPSDDRIKKRNEIASAIMKDANIEVCDMYASLCNHPEYHSDNIHFNDQGIAVQTQILDGILLKPALPSHE